MEAERGVATAFAVVTNGHTAFDACVHTFKMVIFIRVFLPLLNYIKDNKKNKYGCQPH
jgi:hypothetical protein